jgi:glycosyltransferase involved in cell wall biosynthesis
VIVPWDGPLIEELESRNIPHSLELYGFWVITEEEHRRPFLRLRVLAMGALAAIFMASKIREWKCDIFCTNTVAVMSGALAAKLIGLPHIWSIREFGYEDHKFVYVLGDRVSMLTIDLFSSLCIVNSRAVGKKFSRYIPQSKLRVIYNSMNLSLRKNQDTRQAIQKHSDVFTIMILGNLSRNKGQGDAVMALSDLVHGGVPAELLVVGAGAPEERIRLQNLASDEGIGDRVVFKDFQKNPFPLLRTADVLLMCSRCEAFGRVTVEGMLAGKPVIGTRCGGTLELIHDGFNGFLYEPGNHDELAEKLRFLYENPRYAAQMGENGRIWAEANFSEQRLSKDLMEIMNLVRVRTRKRLSSNIV